MYSNPFVALPSVFCNISEFLYMSVKLFADADVQIMSNLGLLLKTVFCKDMKVMQN